MNAILVRGRRRKVSSARVVCIGSRCVAMGQLMYVPPPLLLFPSLSLSIWSIAIDVATRSRTCLL